MHPNISEEDSINVTSTPLREFSSTTDAPLIDESDILILACLGAGVIISAFIICAVTFGCLQWRALQHSITQIQRHVSVLQLSPPEDNDSFDGALTEYEETDIVNPYEGESSKVYGWQNISFIKQIDSLPGICKWTGTLSCSEGERLNVTISYVDGATPKETKSLWHNIIDTKIKLLNHINVLKTLGYCQHEGLTYMIEECFEMKSLNLHLMSDYANIGAVMHETSVVETLQYGLGIVSGMEFLAFQACCHPGLCIQQVLVDMSGTCKLQHFCSLKDAESFLVLRIKSDDNTSWSLAPECKSSLNYTECSDVWAVGITFWEIFIGSETLKEIVTLHENEMFRQLTVILQTSHLPRELSSIMRMCLTHSCNERPSIRDIKKVMESSKKYVLKGGDLIVKNNPSESQCDENDVEGQYYDL
ncbi:fibroblast growth factor receptor 4-like isoform X1 [Apostichopus japonicus]|uniref:fibroblast growth factor receptor 4-like isoform X1 n=1 Tax=Stichopus japonicus TaxID=307972 RepID=UPI003AB21B50